MSNILFQIISSDPLIDSGTDKHSQHAYIDSFYEAEFGKWVTKSPTIFEIGIRTGASLALWKRYFGPKSVVIGADVTSADMTIFEPGVQYIFANAYDSAVANTLPDLDIVVDDGPHSLDSMKQCINLYLPKLKPGGVMIIEDLQNLDWGQELQYTVPHDFKMCTALVDLRSVKQRYDDLLFVIRKPA